MNQSRLYPRGRAKLKPKILPPIQSPHFKHPGISHPGPIEEDPRIIEHTVLFEALNSIGDTLLLKIICYPISRYNSVKESS